MAAKTDVGRVRTNNEDNFQVASDLTMATMGWTNNRVCELGSKGTLLVVADGMGGMNAGEVASEIAIASVREQFATDRLTSEVMSDDQSIEFFMDSAITIADNRIKEEAKLRPETRGMGTTIVIGWLLDKKLYVSWCGDSRAYIFNPVNGLRQISKDHSYVQDLVDSGRLRPEDAFDFPESNIITRCLSDSTTRAIPDHLAVPCEVCDGDIILLCTDGLCGLLRDEETASILSAYTDDMDAAVSALIEGACNAGGSDNVTVCLCQILSGGAVAKPSVYNQPAKVNSICTTIPPEEPSKRRNIKLWVVGVIVAVVAIFAFVIAYGFNHWWMKSKQPAVDNTAVMQTDTCQNDGSQENTGSAVVGSINDASGVGINSDENVFKGLDNKKSKRETKADKTKQNPDVKSDNMEEGSESAAGTQQESKDNAQETGAKGGLTLNNPNKTPDESRYTPATEGEKKAVEDNIINKKDQQSE